MDDRRVTGCCCWLLAAGWLAGWLLGISFFHPLGFDAALLPYGQATSVSLRFFPPKAGVVGVRFTVANFYFSTRSRETSRMVA